MEANKDKGQDCAVLAGKIQMVQLHLTSKISLGFVLGVRG